MSVGPCYDKHMEFSVISWNVWHINQISGKDKLASLLHELERLSDQYEPDCFVLCEVVRPDQHKLPPVVEYLQKLGYTYCHYGPMVIMESPDYCMSGVVICSKFKLTNKQQHVISKNGSAAKFGYPDFDKEIISATMSLPQGVKLNVVSAHPTATIDGIKPHAKGVRSIAKLMRSEAFRQNTLLMGDMNQWRFMPYSLRSRLADIMHVKTGSFLNPTWRYNAHRFTPLRLNLDYVYWSKAGGLRLTDFKVLASSVSDHRPILARFEVAS